MGLVTVTPTDTTHPMGAWQAVAERTTGPGTHPTIIEANGGHPEQNPAPGDEIEVPGYDAPGTATGGPDAPDGAADDE